MAERQRSGWNLPPDSRLCSSGPDHQHFSWRPATPILTPSQHPSFSLHPSDSLLRHSWGWRRLTPQALTFRFCLIPDDPQPAFACVPPSHQERDEGSLFHTHPSRSPIPSSVVPPCIHPVTVFFFSCRIMRPILRLYSRLSVLSGCGGAGLVQGESLDGGRVAAPPDSRVKRLNMTGMKRGSLLQRHALSGILQRLAECAHTHTHTE